MKLLEKIYHAIVILFLAAILGCIIFAGSILIMKFFYFVMALSWFIHIIGIFGIAFLIILFFYTIGRYLGRID